MNKKIVHIGLDVDDTQYHGAALNKATGELFHFKCRPTLKGLLGQLTKVGKQFPKHVLQVVYEASYIGFTLQRDLTDKGIHCEVVAPSSIPRQGGKAVKTDRIDAAQLHGFMPAICSPSCRRRSWRWNRAGSCCVADSA